jgi:cysteine desulfurase family protein
MTIYLDNAASTCPKPPGVIEAVDRCLRETCANPGRGAHRTAVAAARVIYQTRQKAAQFLGVADSADVIFTQNATDSLNIAMHGLLQPGDHVVTSTVEHNAVARPLMALARQGVTVSLITTDAAGRIDTGQLLAAVRPETRLAVLTHGSNITAAIQPVAEIGAALREKGVPFLVDAAQSAGTLPLDMQTMAIDMLAVTGHKGMMGPQGVGLLYISPELELSSVRQGGTGTHSEEEQDTLARPDRYECGTQNTPGIAGLGAGIDFLESEGLENLQRHKTELTQRLLLGLLGLDGVAVYGPDPGEPRGPLVAFNVTGLDSSAVAGRLDHDYDIASRAGLHCAPGAHQVMGTLKIGGAVRMSIGPYNSESDVDAAVAAVGEISSGGER